MIIKIIIFLSFSLTSFLLLLPGFNSSVLGNEITTDWQDNYNSRSRLIIGSYSSDKKLIIGLQLSIEKGSYSYWRNPGDSGIPPIIDFKDSINIESYDIKYPVPEKIVHSFGSSNGYKDNVIFPIILEPVSTKKPLHINVTFDYGICDTVCVPVNNNLSYIISNLGSLSKEKSLLVNEFLERVPNYNNITEKKAIKASLIHGREDNLYLKIELNLSENSSIFIEEHDKLYLSALGPPKKLVNGNVEFNYEIYSNYVADDIVDQILSLVIVTEGDLIKEDITIE
jgi:DsbC/DsbD-like thiol-disulfide interchange protein